MKAEMQKVNILSNRNLGSFKNKFLDKTDLNLLHGLFRAGSTRMGGGGGGH